ncbi:hypothetical protein LD08_03570 [Neisseria meningitidis]|nr:hypothetical protein LD08_03570 [Neisseria meningitidis]
MRAMGFEIRPFDALHVLFPAPPIFQTCNNFNRIYIHHVGNIQDDGKRKPQPVAPIWDTSDGVTAHLLESA